jgi:hypothetical protein
MTEAVTSRTGSTGTAVRKLCQIVAKYSTVNDEGNRLCIGRWRGGARVEVVLILELGRELEKEGTVRKRVVGEGVAAVTILGKVRGVVDEDLRVSSIGVANS